MSHRLASIVLFVNLEFISWVKAFMGKNMCWNDHEMFFFSLENFDLKFYCCLRQLTNAIIIMMMMTMTMMMTTLTTTTMIRQITRLDYCCQWHYLFSMSEIGKWYDFFVQLNLSGIRDLTFLTSILGLLPSYILKCGLWESLTHFRIWKIGTTEYNKSLWSL